MCGLVACGGNKSASTAASPAEGASSSAMSGNAMGSENAGTIPNCGAVKAVWVNTKTKVYHESTDPMYGKTKHGKYMCPSQAKAEGDRPAGGAHHKTM